MLDRISEAISAQNITRVLIISYFIAVALGLIKGVEISRLAEPFLSQDLARHVMRAFVLTLSGMVIFGIWRRAAALVLALVIFWTSYITLYSGGEIGGFWRDLALIGGLLLTANITAYADKALAEDWDDTAEGLDEYLGDDAQDELVIADREGGRFREDFDIVRAT